VNPQNNNQETSIEQPWHASRKSLAASFASGFLLTLGDIKAIMLFLNKYPEMETASLKEIAVNDCILEELKNL